MDEALYDEFGNYIGPELSDDDDSSAGSAEEGSDDDGDAAEGGGAADMETDDGPRMTTLDEVELSESTEIVLHEDKKYYPEASEVYGDETEINVEEEDSQPIEEPIIAPVKSKKFDMLETEMPTVMYTREFATGLAGSPTLVRNIALCGHLHHGKTALMDQLVKQTHPRISSNGVKGWDLTGEVRYTDVRKDEQERGLGIKSTPMSLVLPNGKGKSFMFNVMDTPGHVNFSDEVTASLQLADAVVVVVDVVEGLMLGTERVIKHALREKLAIVLVVAKMDLTANEVDAALLERPKGFPTIRLWPKGAGARPVDYEGERESAMSFVTFVAEHAGSSFKVVDGVAVNKDEL